VTRRMTILAPEGMLGYGIPQRSFDEGMKRNPAALAVDAGSTDPGPYYLGAGVPFTSRRAVKRDLTMILAAAVERGIPAIIGSAGGSGGRPHLDWTLDVYREIAREHHWHLRTAVIAADVDRTWLQARIAEGRVRALDVTTALTVDEVDRSTSIVAQMGLAPLVRALEHDVDVVIAGRACDAAVIGAVPLRAGFDPALVIHMGKILECGGAAAYPRHGTDSLLGTIEDDAFYVEPPNPERICTIASVAAHSLYERADPYVLHLPEGAIDLHDTRFEQCTPRAVRVSGTRFLPAARYTLKLEGVRRVGVRTLTIAGVRDPTLVSQLDVWLANVRERVAEVYGAEGYRLLFHVYGRNGVMGALEPVKETRAHELGLVIEAVADDAETSAAILALARSVALHATYPGRKAIAGNLAFPFSPSDLKAGDAFEFNVHHLVEVDDPMELFPIDVVET
jgi:acyclic terpene utilization AtuA family protein